MNRNEMEKKEKRVAKNEKWNFLKRKKQKMKKMKKICLKILKNAKTYPGKKPDHELQHTHHSKHALGEPSQELETSPYTHSRVTERSLSSRNWTSTAHRAHPNDGLPQMKTTASYRQESTTIHFEGAKIANSNPMLLQLESFLVDDFTFLYCRSGMWRTFHLNFEGTQELWLCL